MNKHSYTCPHCGDVLPKKEAKVSGWDSQSSIKHVQCPKWGKSRANWLLEDHERTRLFERRF